MPDEPKHILAHDPARALKPAPPAGEFYPAGVHAFKEDEKDIELFPYQYLVKVYLRGPICEGYERHRARIIPVIVYREMTILELLREG